MTPEFSIKNIKGRDIIRVCEIIEQATNVKCEEYILRSLESGDVSDFCDALNLINYLAFKTLLVVDSEKNTLHDKLSKFNN